MLVRCGGGTGADARGRVGRAEQAAVPSADSLIVEYDGASFVSPQRYIVLHEIDVVHVSID